MVLEVAAMVLPIGASAEQLLFEGQSSHGSEVSE
jgi:hypothetical protein